MHSSHHPGGVTATLLIGLLVAAAPSPGDTGPPEGGASITITAPNGGEVWTAGTTYEIEWYDFGVSSSDTFEISLLRDGTPMEVLGRVSAENIPRFDWRICEFTGDAATYTIRVACVECDPPVWDDSDAPFAITGSLPFPTFALTSPNGGEIWDARTPQTITWTATDPHGFLEIWLLKGGASAALLGYVPMAEEAFVWDVCPYLDAGTDYAIRLVWRDICGPVQEDTSDAPFTLANTDPRPTLTLTSPNGGEVWTADSVQTITWTSTNPTGDVELWLTDEQSVYEYLGAVPMAAGQFTWPLLPCLDDGTAYKINACWTACQQTVLDASDAPFEIAGSVEPVLTLTSPPQGTFWSAGTSQLITWTSNMAHGDAVVEVRGDTCWVNVGTVPVAAGQLQWDICPGIGDGVHAVRVRHSTCAVESVSAPFTITGSVTPTLTLLSPVGGETWTAGQPATITWTSTGLTGDLLLFVPNDERYQTGQVRVPVAAGSFTWPIAPTLTWPLDPVIPTLSYSGVWLWSSDCGQAVYVRGNFFDIVPGTSLPGDLDGDGDVDLADLACAQMSFTDRGPLFLDPISDSFDFEPDGDMDIDDFDLLAAGTTGPQ